MTAEDVSLAQELVSSRVRRRDGAPQICDIGLLDVAFDEATATRAFRNGDAAGLEWLAKRYMKYAAVVARTFVRSPCDAEDIVQDAFVRAWAQRHRFTHGRPFAPWFLSIVRNRALDLIRHRAVAREEAIDIHHPAPRRDRPDIVAHARIAADIAYDALRRLPPMQRTVASLALLGGFDHAEIASMMSLREATVRSHLALARKRLREELRSVRVSV
jgi:RNA polymerase sigma-70 factor (ECF subfamily)